MKYHEQTLAVPRTVTVDIGRSTTRMRVDDEPTSRLGQGAGLGDPDGAQAIARLVRYIIGAGPRTPWRLAVAVPGVLARPIEASELGSQLSRCWPRPPELVLIASDVAAWHAGALSGRDGVVLSIGTGAVALGVRDGAVRQADGRGPLLGDEGGGAWIGLEGLRAAARATDGRGPATALTSLTAPAQGGSALPTAAALARVAPRVLSAARRGDQVAAGILDTGTDALARTAAAAAKGAAAAAVGTGEPGAGAGAAALGGVAAPDRPHDNRSHDDRPHHDATARVRVAVVGGLADALLPRLRQRHPGTDWATPDGDAMDGLNWLLDHTGTALETGLVRVRPVGPPGRDAPATSVPGELGGDRVDAEVDSLPTEARRPGSEQIDLLPTAELVARLLEGQAAAAPTVARATGALTVAVDQVAAAFRRGGRMIYVGAGTPGRLAVQDAAELTPTFGLDPARVPTLLAGGATAASAAVENAEDNVDAARAAVAATGVGPDDVVVGVSASGRTPFVRAALEAARERGAATVAIVSAPAAPVARDATVVIELLTGPEVLAGSTRLAAGTAQKIALNTLSTAAMVRTGATYGGWMVGVRATNAKLRRRGVRIVRDAAGVDEETAAELITAAAGDVRIALVSALTGLDVATAREHLADTGSVRVAIDAARHAERGGRPRRGGEGEPGWDESYRVEPVGQAGL
ncbi:MAG: N-acetylmuramic acid 6-phosphate etherase [Pseudonocardiales bacterium]|nr:N-acetylmuramic acid 6-phosphate etherase [Pseudonocardiales bacterium]